MNATNMCAVMVLAASATAALAAGPPRFAAGEWETSNDAGPARHVCQQVDRVFDAPTITRMFAMMKMKCSSPVVSSSGPITTYVLTCAVAGGRMTEHGTITPQGPSAYTSRVQGHLEGASVKISDADLALTQVSRRLGPCQARDVISPF